MKRLFVLTFRETLTDAESERERREMVDKLRSHGIEASVLVLDGGTTLTEHLANEGPTLEEIVEG